LCSDYKEFAAGEIWNCIDISRWHRNQKYPYWEVFQQMHSNSLMKQGLSCVWRVLSQLAWQFARSLADECKLFLKIAAVPAHHQMHAHRQVQSMAHAI